MIASYALDVSASAVTRTSTSRLCDDAAREAAASAYQLTQDLSQMADEQLARVFCEHRSTVSRKRRGLLGSKQSKTRNQILRLGAAGGNPWPLVADTIAAAIQSTMTTRTPAELRAAKECAYPWEQRSNGRFDRIQFDHLRRRPVCPRKSRMAPLEQAVWSLILVALEDELISRGEPHQ